MNFDSYLIVPTMDYDKYIWVKYFLETKTTLLQGAKELVIGQSIGNPNARSVWETEEMVKNHVAVILDNKNLSDKSGVVFCGFPRANLNYNYDGISQLLCMTMGGQMDIDNIVQCHMLDIDLVDLGKRDDFPFFGNKPHFGMSKTRNLAKSHNKPLFGGILKPKTGVSPETLLDMTKQLLDGGVDFIKEDEILGSPEVCNFETRVNKIVNYIKNNNYSVVYTFCINADAGDVLRKAKYVQEAGGMGVHLNFWSGLGTYRTINDKFRLFMHYQKSGDKILTSKRNAYRIDWTVMVKLAALCGVDSIHAGMLGGYLSDDEEEMKYLVSYLKNKDIIPALSCGMNADLIEPICQKIGNHWMANVGGAIHSDPAGTTAGALKIRKAIDAVAGKYQDISL